MSTNSIYYQVTGNGPDLILIHGWGWRIAVWQSLVSQLKKRYRLTLIDLPGHGNSLTFDLNYSLDKIAQTILNIAPPRAIWIGWSLGGLIATWVAIHYPSRIKKLILLACSPSFLEDYNWPGIKRVFFEKFASELEKDIKSAMRKFFILQCYQDNNIKFKKAHLKKILFYNTKNSTSQLRKILKILFNTDLRKKLIQIQCPSLLFLGEQDPLIPISIASKINNYMPKLNLVVIPKASHLLFLSKSSLFLKNLEWFLKDVNNSLL